jgi:hypothetical protein
MRKRLLLIGLPVLVAFAAAVVLFFPFGTPPPHEFLDGHQPLQGYPLSDKKDELNYELAYTFPADYESLVKIARSELLKKHYQQENSSRANYAYFYSHRLPGMRTIINPGERLPTSPEVHILRDRQYQVARDPKTGHTELKNFPEKGWVAVYIRGVREPGLFEQIRSWFGL